MPGVDGGQAVGMEPTPLASFISLEEEDIIFNDQLTQQWHNVVDAERIKKLKVW